MTDPFMQVWIINLDQRPDRFENAKRQAEANGLLIERHGACSPSNGDVVPASDVATQWETTLNAKFDHSYAPYAVLQMSLGERGCAMSHIQLWRKVVARQLPMAMIFEDDVLLAPQFSDRVQHHLAHLPDDWDIFYLEYANGSPASRVCKWPALYKGVYVWHTGAYVISLKGATTCLKHLPVDAPVDNFLARLMHSGLLHAYLPFPALAEQSGADSDIEHTHTQAWSHFTDAPALPPTPLTPPPHPITEVSDGDAHRTANSASPAVTPVLASGPWFEVASPVKDKFVMGGRFSGPSDGDISGMVNSAPLSITPVSAGRPWFEAASPVKEKFIVGSLPVVSEWDVYRTASSASPAVTPVSASGQWFEAAPTVQDNFMIGTSLSVHPPHRAGFQLEVPSHGNIDGRPFAFTTSAQLEVPYFAKVNSMPSGLFPDFPADVFPSPSLPGFPTGTASSRVGPTSHSSQPAGYSSLRTRGFLPRAHPAVANPMLDVAALATGKFLSQPHMKDINLAEVGPSAILGSPISATDSTSFFEGAFARSPSSPVVLSPYSSFPLEPSRPITAHHVSESLLISPF
eukprot:GGOE01004644.1.p1 GENE.GGOE01004644.1~~GGOE01004644.1.p1  ORF type:complete len:590 (+),score=80.80 GGOE01004644.1:53-1771(+)